MSDIFNSGYAPLHLINICIHVGFGTVAILLGISQFFTRKGESAHAWIGRAYLGLFCVVILTAILGSVAFGFRAFLVALTLSAGYWLISGLRALKIRDCGPRPFDHAAALASIVLAVLLAGFMRNQPEQSTVAAYIALGNVVLICLYDLARGIGGAAWLKRSWLNEHIYKMIGSHGALISAAGGNLFLNLQPWSIFLPPMISFILVGFFILRHPLSKVARV